MADRPGERDSGDAPRAPAKSPSLMRNLGAFFGHIAKAVRTDPSRRREVRRKVEEERRGNVILRRTTIEEVELRSEDDRDHDDDENEARAASGTDR